MKHWLWNLNDGMKKSTVTRYTVILPQMLKVQCCSYRFIMNKDIKIWIYLCIVVDVLIFMNYIWKDYWLWSFVKSILTMINTNDIKKNIMSGPVVTRNISAVALVLEHYFIHEFYYSITCISWKFHSSTYHKLLYKPFILGVLWRW